MIDTNNEIKLTDNEWEIYECLWEKAPQTLAQIRKCYSERTGQSRSTAETMVARMEKKGYFRVEQGEKAKLFYPIVKREDAVKKETHSFLKKIYDGKPGLLMSAMAESEELSRQEIDELYEILRKAKEKRNG